MKKQILVSLLAGFMCLQTFAIPAKPGRFTYTEPDGTVRELERHGDEFFHWTTDATTGQVVELDMAGYWRPSRLDDYRLQQADVFRRQVNQYRLESNADEGFSIGTLRIPVILVEFSDEPFSVKDPRTKFDNLLNKPGYSDFQATGSVRDYFWENSHGLFTPVFDVYGPVKLPHEMAYYGEGESANGQLAAQAVIDGAQLLDSQIDFSQYDADGDSAVDMILMYYSGYSEAEGGPVDAIWPHQWYVNEYKTVMLDGKLLSRYFCTAELRGSQGANMCSIGATCHEFSHALGLPDFYDTDNDKNGTCSALGRFSLMCSGCYNDNARTPPFLNAEERVMLGWMDADDIRELPDGESRFGSVRDNVAYKSLTDTEGEYFLYECRDGSSWDAPLPAGMVTYHVDKSPWHTLGGISCDVLWKEWVSFNNLNCYGNHPCFYVVPAADQRNLQFNGALDGWVFPGAKKVKEFHPVDWDGKDSGVNLFNIRYDESEAQVSVMAENHFRREIHGTVLSQDGKPVHGVYISLTADGAGRRIRRKGSPGTSKSVETTTGPDGSFVLDVKDFQDKASLAALKPGYYSYVQEVDLLARITPLEIRLRNAGVTGESEIHLYDENSEMYCYGKGIGTEMASSLFSAEDLRPGTGRKIGAFQYTLYANSAEALYFIVDDAYSGERLVTYPVQDFQVYPVGTDPEEWVFWADVSEAGFRIPSGKDLYIGYAVKEADYHYPFIFFEGMGNYYASEFDLNRSRWDKSWTYLDLMIAITLEDDEPVADVDSLSKLGVNFIDPGPGVYKAGESFQLQLVESPSHAPASVRWFWDGEETGAKSVTLTAGEHTVEARLAYSDGSGEVLELPIVVD